MGKCSVCGKHGLFLKVSSEGLCKKCEEAKEFAKHQLEEKQKVEAQNFYNLLAELYCILKRRTPAPKDTIDETNTLTIIGEQIQTCRSLRKQLDRIPTIPYLESTIISNLYYDSALDEQIHYAKLKSFDFSMWTHRRDPSLTYCQELNNKLLADVNSYEIHCQNRITRIKKNTEFETLCRELPRYPITYSQNCISLNSVADLENQIKYSRITAKTSYDRIGSFIVLDTETTGLSSIKDEITEISAVRFEDWTPVIVFHSLIKPKKSIPEDIVQKTGITNEMVSSAPSLSEIIPCLNEFIGKSNIVGHNLPFDIKFLYRNGLDFTSQKRKYYDTLALAKTTLKKPRMKWDRELESYEINYDYDVENYKLSTLCDYYEIRSNFSAHRSTSDALATGIVFHKLVLQKNAEA